MKPMIAAERDYHRRVMSICSKTASGFQTLEDGNRPTVASVGARITEKRQLGLQKMSLEDSQYRAWLQEHAEANDQRNRVLARERAASMAEFEAECKKRDEHRNAQAQKMAKEARETMTRLTSLSTVQRPGDSMRSTVGGAGFRMGTPRAVVSDEPTRAVAADFGAEGRAAAEKVRLAAEKERTAAEQHYWRWARNLKDTQRCSVDQAWDLPLEEEEIPAAEQLQPVAANSAKAIERPAVAASVVPPLPGKKSLPWNQKSYHQQRHAKFASTMQNLRHSISDDMIHRGNRAKAIADGLKASTVEHQKNMKRFEVKLESRTLMLEDMYAPVSASKAVNTSTSES